MRLGATLAAGALALAAVGTASAQDEHPGRAPYDRWCAGCHGVDGRGDGPAAPTMLPRPRDFTTGSYQIRTTASGELPTDADILRMIDEGMPGTAMPGWRDHLDREQREALVEYLKTFSPFFASEAAPEPLAIGSAPGVDEEGLAEGRRSYEEIECWKCHGQAGRGDGPSAPTLEDDLGFPVRAADLTEGWNFTGGSSAEEIHVRLMTGLNGTPMPSFADLIDAEFMTEEQLWRLSQYVASLSPERPEVREVVRAVRLEAGLPAGLDDPAWAGIEPGWIPLVGQLVVEPRWFAPSVDGVWVRAVHDGSEIALLVEWNDPSESPDPDWDEWTAKVARAMAGELDPTEEGADEGTVDEPVEALTDTPQAGAPAAVDRLPDALAIQFPTAIPEGMDRPYFLMGDADEPVYLWLWSSDAAGREATARGLAAVEPLSESEIRAEAAFTDGRWRLLVRRSLAAGDAEGRLGFEVGRSIPMAVFAWDGSNGESETRVAISTWYFLYLDEPPSRRAVAVPLAATLLTAALGLIVVVRAQRRSGGRAERNESD